MSKLTLTIALIVLFIPSAYSAYFTQYGSMQHVQYKPVNSPIDFKYDVLYYIPAKLKGKKNLNTLVFLHGGGRSTSDRAGSLRVAKVYMPDMMKIADDLGVVLIAPSGSGINWGGHMLSYLKDLNQTLRAELPINPNKIALTGHSMGGMGITRSAHWLADEFAFFMPVAAGMDEKHATESNLRPYFNMNYYHLQGLKDHFSVFITRCKNQKKQIEALEVKYDKKSKFTLEFYDGSHNYPRLLYTKRLGELFKSSTRDVFQKELHGMLYYIDKTYIGPGTYGNNTYYAPRNRFSG